MANDKRLQEKVDNMDKRLAEKDTIINQFMGDKKRLQEKLNNTDKRLADLQKELAECRKAGPGNTTKRFDLEKVRADPNLTHATYPANGKTYFINMKMTLTYKQAIDYCKQFGAQLIEPKSELENDFIFKMFEPKNGTFGFVGAKCEDRQLPMTFLSGGIIRWTNWMAPEPALARFSCSTINWNMEGQWYVASGDDRTRGRPLCEST